MSRPVLVAALAAALFTLPGCAALNALGASPADTALGVADAAAETYLAFRGKLPAPPPTTPNQAGAAGLTIERLLALLEYLAQLEGWCTAAERDLALRAAADPELGALIAQLHQLKARAVAAQSSTFAQLPTAPP